MRKVFLTIIFIVISIISFVAINPIQSLFAEEKFVSPLSSTSSQKISYSTYIAQPLILSIPKIGVEGLIESVSVDEKKRMEMPQDYDKLGWYEKRCKAR
jgi:hypothetical protein